MYFKVIFNISQNKGYCFNIIGYGNLLNIHLFQGLIIYKVILRGSQEGRNFDLCLYVWLSRLSHQVVFLLVTHQLPHQLSLHLKSSNTLIISWIIFKIIILEIFFSNLQLVAKNFPYFLSQKSLPRHSEHFQKKENQFIFYSILDY